MGEQEVINAFRYVMRGVGEQGDCSHKKVYFASAGDLEFSGVSPGELGRFASTGIHSDPLVAERFRKGGTFKFSFNLPYDATVCLYGTPVKGECHRTSEMSDLEKDAFLDSFGAACI